MIDLEDALSALVDRALEPPALANVERRGKQRRRRRRGIATAAALALVVAGVGSAAAIVSSRSTPHVAAVPPTEHVRVTLLDGSQMEISGPESLGLTNLEPVFNAQLDNPSSDGSIAIGHSFTVQRSGPEHPGRAIASYPTHDGHELVVHSTPKGVGAIVQYGKWSLVVAWNTSPTSWAQFADALNAYETPDGFLVIDPVDPAWHLGPTDAPDVQLGAAAYGSDPEFSFFGPSTYPSGCPTPNTGVQTSQGWPVSLTNGAWWCDPDAKVRVSVGDPHLADAAIKGLRVSYADAEHSVVTVRSLTGVRLEITAPGTIFDEYVAHATLAVDGVHTPSPVTIAVSRFNGPRLPGPKGEVTSADGHQLVVTQDRAGEEGLVGTYGDWGVSIFTTGASAQVRSLIGSLFAAHETADGFLVLDPKAPMHLAAGSATDVGLDGVAIRVTPNSHPSVRVIGGNNPMLASQVEARLAP